MPAEIDTGGPRVLHCAERADCPIPRGAPTTTTTKRTTTTISRSLPAACRTSGSPIRARRPRRQRRRRCPIDDSNDDDDDDDDDDGDDEDDANPSSAEPRIVPGNDERDEFFRDDATLALPATSSGGLGGGASQRTDFSRRRIGRAIGAVDDAEIATRRRSRVDPPPREAEEVVPVDDTRQRLPISADLTAIGEPAAYVIRLFERRCGCGCVEAGGESPRPIFGRSAAISSQRDHRRDRPRGAAYETRELLCVECAWQCERFECVRDAGEAGKSEASRRATKIGSRRRPRHAQHKGRSYVQLALLLLLVALGHGSLLRSNAGARRGGFAATGVAIGALVGAARAAPVDLDAGVRAERSANLSHITGVSRKIQMYIKNRHLQILPDGSVNGSNDDTSEYTIFQRTSVSRGQLRIQGVATCLYLCMDSCGLLYGSREYTDDCVFNETLEQHNYNSYSSVRWSTAKKTLYLGLNRWGQPRRVQAKGHNLGRLSAYARVLTQVAPPDRVEALQARMLGAQHNLRHHHNSHHHRNVQQTVCPNLPPQEKDGRDKFRCRKRKKRKKRKRRCHKGEKPGPQCEVAEEHRGTNAETSGEGQPQSKRSCEGAASEEMCRKQALDAPAKKRKSRIEGSKGGPGDREKQQEKQQKQQQQPRNRGKEVRQKKPEGARKPNGSGSTTNEESRNRPHGPNGGKRKRPPAKQRPGASRKKVPGRVTRTSVATSPTPPAITLPTTWYPGASTTPSMEDLAAVESSSWRRTKTAASPRNAVTSGELKSSDVRSRGGKALEVADVPPDSSITEASAEIEDRSTSSFVDSSMENSEETKSDESVLEEDTTTASGEYSTLMTTMDTTPPERTEDYTRATTPSMMPSGDAYGGSINDFQDTVKSRTGVGRLAM